MKDYEIGWKIMLGIGIVVFMLNGNLAHALEGKGFTSQYIMVQKNSPEVSTLFVRGTLVEISKDAYVIRNMDDEEFTVIVTKDTFMKEKPRVGDHVEIEFLENGRALVVILNQSEK